MGVQYPNKIYTLEFKGSHPMIENSMMHFVVVVAAANKELAKEYVKEKIGFIAEPTWLMNGAYPTIWTRDGSKPEKRQVTILYNGSANWETKGE